MRCRTCGKTVAVSNRNHNKDHHQCARCHYFGQIAAYPGAMYRNGKKWCSYCGEWQYTDKERCEKCKHQLRTKPQRKVFREKVKVVVRY